MNPVFQRASALCVIATLATTVAAEDAAVPTPTTTPPVAGAPAAAATPAAPEAPTPIAKPAGGAEGTPRVYGIAAAVNLGYDSNILLEPDNSPSATDTSGIALGGDLRGTLRLVDREGYGLKTQGQHGERLSVSAIAGLRDYPGHSPANQWRAGAQVAGHERLSWGDPGFVVGYNHYNIDHRTAADAVNADVYASRVSPGYRDVDILLVGGEYLRYPLNTDKSGELATLGYRHWFLLRPSDIHRRIEAGLSASYYDAKAKFETFYGIAPAVGAAWRLGEGQRLGTVDLAGSLSYEWRQYGAASGLKEHQGLFGVGVGADAWVCSNSTVGLYVAYGHRESNFPTDTYTRFQAGARLAAIW